jgi:hypothetical protein
MRTPRSTDGFTTLDDFLGEEGKRHSKRDIDGTCPDFMSRPCCVEPPHLNGIDWKLKEIAATRCNMKKPPFGGCFRPKLLIFKW